MTETLFITGGTGALGAALLERLAAVPEVERVFVLTRSDPWERHAALCPPLRRRGKITFVRGDVTDAGLGLAPAAAADVAACATTILHGAADTRFSAPLDEAGAVNVGGARNALAFAVRCARLTRFVHLSTVYVAGRRTGRIFEADLDHAAGFLNFYEQSKYEAERLVRARMDALPVAVLRLSTIVGDSRTGRPSRLAAIHHALRFFYRSLAPMLPGAADSPVDLIALDYAAAAVAHLSLAGFAAGQTFHLAAGGDALPLGDLLALTCDAFVRHRPAWRRRAIEMPALADLRTFELFVRSVDEVGDALLRQSVNHVRHFAPQLAFPKTFDDAACAAALAAAGIRRPLLRDLYPRVVRALVESDWCLDPAGADRCVHFVEPCLSKTEVAAR